MIIITKLQCLLGKHKEVTQVLYNMMDRDFSGTRVFCIRCHKMLRTTQGKK